MSNLQESILQHVYRPGYQPVKLKVIAKKLGVADEGVRDLRRAVKKLIKQGKLAYGPSHIVLPAADRLPKAEAPTEAADGKAATKNTGDRITGEFRRMSAGYGFVRPSATPHELGRREDVYIPAQSTHDASSGDVVLVRLTRRRRGPRGPEGEILEVVERETNRFVGTYYEHGGQGVVQVDGKVFAQPIVVGDPGAKGAQLNDKVVIEMVRFPSHLHDGDGVIIKVLGPRGTPGVDTLSVVHEFGLPGDFAADAMEEARLNAERFDETIVDGRVDFTGETVITIDPEDARDFDDAISLKRLENGHWQLGVHIADVSHFVPEKTPLDREARDRATSVYLPDMVIPMLPEIVSNNLASLQPGRVRYTLSALMEMTPEGTRVATEVRTGAIRSCRRFTYEEVDDFLADREKWRSQLEPGVHRLLSDMHELAMTLRRRRFDRGALELHLPEVKIDLDKQGRVTGAHLEEQTESHQIIEEFMLAANEAIARRLLDKDIVFIRRIHERPDERKLEALGGFVRELGFRVDSLESRQALQDLVAAVRETPQEHAVNYAILRSMQKAIYSPEQEGHYALASDCYCHFTSPIRRYPDLTVHRLLKTLAGGKKPKQDLDEIYAEAEHCSSREQRAVEAERELNKIKLLNYLATRLGEEMDGIITGVETYGLFIRGIKLPAEGFAHISSLTDDYYRHERATHSLIGTREGNYYRLGDAVRVAVAHVDVDARELDFRILGKLAEAPKPKKKAKGKKGKAAKKKPGKTTRKKAKGRRKRRS